MKRYINVVSIAMGLLLCASAHGDEDQAVKDVAGRVVRALFECDAKAVRELATTMTDKEWATVQLYLDEERQYDRLERELFKRFPQEARDRWPDNPPDETLKMVLNRLGDAKVARLDQGATIEIEHVQAFEFKNQAGVWKFDAATWVNERVHPQFNDWERRAKVLTKAYGELADQLANGAFKNVDEVRTAVGRIGAGPTSRPEK